MNFSISALAASFVFGIFGIYLFKHGKKHSHGASIGIGLALMVYPYFIENEFLLWAIGVVLLGFAYRLLNR